MDSIQNRYALALFSLAKEENLVEDYQEKIKVVRQITGFTILSITSPA